MRGVLVDYDEAVLGLRDNIGRRDLPARDSKRIAWHWLDSWLGAGRRRVVEELLVLGDQAGKN